MLHNIDSLDHFNPHILFTIHGVIDKDHPYTSCYHSHHFLELSIVTSGSIKYLIEGDHYTLQKGDVMIYNPNTFHQALIDEDTYCEEIHIGISNMTIALPSKTPILSIKRYFNEFLEVCASLQKEKRLGSLGHHFMLKALVMQLIVLVYREIYYAGDSPTSIEHERSMVVQNIIDYMSYHYMHDITLDHISKIMYLSPAYISKLFKEEVGDSPINYLIKIRLKKAMELLEKENLPVRTVGERVGYKDAYYFSKLFKKHYGFPPSQVKKVLPLD